mmetsp:Transcript_99610/g.253191  ORF Transcript_99610/g.253191 Transcript_99610/m.253191 type:complete len:337 (+) Transcript_99610:129-1139(+)
MEIRTLKMTHPKLRDVAHSHDRVQELADHWEEGEADAAGQSDLHHARDGSREKGRRALVLHHLLGTIDSALVELLRGLTLHARFHAILRLCQEDRAASCQKTRCAVVEGVLLLSVVSHGDHREDLHLQGHAHCLVRPLLQNRGECTAVQAHGAFVLQYLHDGIGRAFVIARAAALVICDSSLDGLHRCDGADSLANASTQSAQHVHRGCQLPRLLVTRKVDQVRVGSPTEHLLETCANDAYSCSSVQALDAVLLNGLRGAIHDALVLRIGLGLELQLRLHVLRGIRQGGLCASCQETLDHGLRPGVLLRDESHCLESAICASQRSRRASRGLVAET